MSGRNPSPGDQRGTSDDPGRTSDQDQPPEIPGQAYRPPPAQWHGPLPAQGYGPPAAQAYGPPPAQWHGPPPAQGYGPQPGYGYPPYPGYAWPGGPTGPPPGRARRRAGLWLGLGGGVALAAAIAFLLAFTVFAGNPAGQAWTLISASNAGGLPRNDAPGISAALGNSIGTFRAQFARMPHIGQIASAVAGVYNLAPIRAGAVPRLVVFVGLNGTFNPRAVLTGMTAGGETLPEVAAGSHGGTAECGNDSSGSEACIWVTSTTIGFLVVEPNGAEAAGSLDRLMIKMRTSLERPSG